MHLIHTIMRLANKARRTRECEPGPAAVRVRPDFVGLRYTRLKISVCATLLLLNQQQTQKANLLASNAYLVGAVPFWMRRCECIHIITNG